MPKISVIMPVYKVEPYLRRCIDSVLAQTYTNFELILVDDGSPDGCPAICDEYAQKDPRIVVIHQENSGVSAARNAGLDIAAGEYIAFVDSDDIVSEHFLEFLYQTLIISNADISYCGIKWCASESELALPNEYRTYERQLFHDEEIINNFFSGWILPNCCNKLYRKSALGDLRFPDAKRSEDLWFSYHAVHKAHCIAGIKHCVLYYYMQRPGSAIRTVTDSFIEDEFKRRFDIYKTLQLEQTEIAYKFGKQTWRVFVDFWITVRKGKQNNDCRKCLRKWAKLLCDKIWIPVAQTAKERFWLSILKLSPRMYVFILLIRHKLFGTNFYV